MKRALPISGQLKFVGLMQMIRNRHLAEWRFPLFTQIVMVKLPIWNVSVIGMTLTPFRRCSQPPIRLLQCSFRPLAGLGLFYQGMRKMSNHCLNVLKKPDSCRYALLRSKRESIAKPTETVTWRKWRFPLYTQTIIRLPLLTARFPTSLWGWDFTVKASHSQ